MLCMCSFLYGSVVLEREEGDVVRVASVSVGQFR